MPSKDVHRFSVFVGDHTLKLIDNLTEKGKVGKAGLLEVVLLGLEAKGLDPAEFLDEGLKRRKEVNPDQRRNRGDVIAKLARMPREELEKVVAQMEAVPK